MRLAAPAAILLALACVTPANAQISSVEPGDRVRLRLDTKQALTGEVISASADSLTLRIHPEATTTTLPIATLRSLEVSRGEPSAWTSSLNSAIAAAGLLGAQFALGEGARGRELGKHAGWGAVGGAALGLVAGALFPEERWSPLSLPHSPVDVAEALRFPSYQIAGRWGAASGRAGSGSGGGARVSAGVARLDDDTHLRAEFSFERSTLQSGAVAYSETLGEINSHEENRRYSVGLTVVENTWRIGESVQTYFSFGLGVTQSRVSGETHWACGAAWPCNVGGIAYGFDSGRDHRGTYAIGGFGVAMRVQGMNLFAEVRSQMMDDGANEPGSFTPLSVGVSF